MTFIFYFHKNWFFRKSWCKYIYKIVYAFHKVCDMKFVKKK